MSKFTFAFTKEKKQIFIPNGDKTRYVEILGCPIESVNGTYYQMDPITINDKTYRYCFTNGIYMFENQGLATVSLKYLYELNNSLLIQKFHFNYYYEYGIFYTNWFNSETSELVPEMDINYFGDWEYGFG